MKRTRMMFAALSLMLICAPGLADAQVKTDISAILSNPNDFDGRKVEVEGRVESIRSRISGKGAPYTMFMLAEDGGTVSVYTLGDLLLKEGETVKVVGRFQKIRYVSKYEFKNEIDATEGTVEKASEEIDETEGPEAE